MYGYKMTDMGTVRLTFTSKGFVATNEKKPLAKVFTVTKNEYDLIEDFINYYGRIFGYENVVIIDNGSDHPTVLNVYDRYRSHGVTIHNTVGYQNNKQAEHFTTIMKQYRQSAEFLIGLDTDCFFCVNRSCDPAVIQEYLRSLPTHADLFAMKTFLMSVVDVRSENYQNNKLVRPTDCVTFVVRDNYAQTSNPHVFFRAANFVSTENGNHNGTTTTNKRFYCPEVAYVHYHDTGRMRHLERCRSIMLGYGFIHKDDTEAEQLDKLLKLSDGTGIHRQRQYIRYLQDPKSFFEEDPMPEDTFVFVEVKRLLGQ
jgi:hypothetical protein